MSCTARIKGIPQMPTVNARGGPALSYPIVYQASVWTANLPVLDVQVDEQGLALDGKVYRWLKVVFPNNTEGWVRDDLIEIAGDCSALGYKNTSDALVLAFSLSHEAPSVTLGRQGPDQGADEQEVRGIGGDVCLVTLTGDPNLPLVNARSGPGPNHGVIFQMERGTSRIYVIDVADDESGADHRWFNLAFPNGQTGWMRDDVIAIQGDCTPVGYEHLDEPVLASRAPRLSSEPVAVEPVAGTAPDSGCEGTVISTIPAKVRSGPNVTYNIVTTVEPNTVLPIDDSRAQDDGGDFIWLLVTTQEGQTGWIRSDLMRYQGDCADFGVVAASDDLYPSPMRRYFFTQGYGGINGHRGWDLALEDEAILSGPMGGRVVRAHPCSRCTPDKPAWRHHGIPYGDQNALRDPGWGWGYGNHVIVRYLHDRLPPSTRQKLAELGLAGHHLYVVYAHLKEMYPSVGDELTAETELGTCGDTGWSSGPHLHLEVRAGPNPDSMGSWLSLALLDPAVLFNR
ncbi:MAG: SH3 domain-containing protein [Anaerolineae bacterium]